MQDMRERKKQYKIIKITIFSIILIIVTLYLSSTMNLLAYSWNTSGNTDTNFYGQPSNSIETIFLGTSLAMDSVAPLTLYEEYGISSFNLATSAQPVAVSYYWLLEAFDNHQDTLKTVVFNTSSLKNEGGGYEQGILPMQNSKNKYNLVKSHVNELNEFIGHISPIFYYHSRWKELKQNDFVVENKDGATTRGYFCNTNLFIGDKPFTDIIVPNYIVNKNNREIDEKVLAKESVFYMEKMIAFCLDHNLKLVFVQTPVDYWTDTLHYEIQSLADKNSLEFYDFNYIPLIEEIDYNVALDSFDMHHMNYYGAIKFTDWIGNYLTTNCNATDVRELEEYAHIDEELRIYKRKTLEAKLVDIIDLSEYIDAVNSDEAYTILLTVNGTVSDNLMQEQRIYLKSIGLEKLAEFQDEGAYLGVLENGQVIYEKSLERNNKGETDDMYLVYEAEMSDGTSYLMESGGGELRLSHYIIGGQEYYNEHQGISVVVYDNETNRVIDNASFDIDSPINRVVKNAGTRLDALLASGVTPDELTGSERELYLYNMRCEDEYKVKTLNNQIDEPNLYEYLTEFLGNENYVILLSAKEMTEKLNQSIISKFASLGLTQLSQLNENEQYVGIVDGGQVVVDEKNDTGESLEVNLFDYEVISGCSESDNLSSIRIKGQEYSNNLSGINVVIYNKRTELIIDSKTFSGVEE